MKNKAINICKRLQDNGYEAVFAGGCVRDMILGIEPNDYDVATSATPSDIKKIFKNAKFVGESFGVSLIGEIEVATFRTDGSYMDGRRPDNITFSTMEEDAERRDLTINAIFFDPIKGNYLDCVGGFNDIDNKLIRFIGDADKRIDEDNLRIMRAIRFASRFYFRIDMKSFDAIIKNAYKTKDLSGERILEELKKGMKVNPEIYIKSLRGSGVLKHILPEVYDLIGSKQSKKWHPEGATVQEVNSDIKIPYDPNNPEHSDKTKYKFNHGDVFIHTMLVLEKLGDVDWKIKFAALLHDIGKPATQVFEEDGRITNKGHDKLGAEMTEVICKRLKMSNSDTDFIVALVKGHMNIKDILHMKKSTLRRFIAKPYYLDLIKLVEADTLGTGYDHDMSFVAHARDEYEKYTNEPEEPAMPEPFIDGYDLINIGMNPGPQFKELLDIMMDKQLEGTIESRLDAIAYLQFIGGIIRMEQ